MPDVTESANKQITLKKQNFQAFYTLKITAPCSTDLKLDIQKLSQ